MFSLRFFCEGFTGLCQFYRDIHVIQITDSPWAFPFQRFFCWSALQVYPLQKG